MLIYFHLFLWAVILFMIASVMTLIYYSRSNLSEASFKYFFLANRELIASHLLFYAANDDILCGLISCLNSRRLSFEFVNYSTYWSTRIIAE